MRRHRIKQPQRVPEKYPHPKQIRIKRVSYRSLHELNRGIKALMDKLPTDIDLVAGIPRCGMIPATLLAMYWNLPLTDVYSLCEKKLYPKFIDPDKWDFSKIHKVLIIDDSIASGRNLDKVKALINSSGLTLEFIYAVIYATEQTKNKVDYYVEIIPHPRFWEWDITTSKYLQDGCTDIDGILCRNPTKEEQSTPEKLSGFYKTVNPWIRPPQLDTIVTGRLERYRPETEAWLKEHGFKYNQLIMQPDKGDHATFKAKTYKDLDNSLFIESSPKEAEIISRTGKQVITPFVKHDRKLKILLHIMNMSLPGGASISCCEIMAALYRRGHECKITSSKQTRELWIQSEIQDLATKEPVEMLYRWADVVLIHWFMSKEAIEITSRIPKPRVHYICDLDSPQRFGMKNAALLIFNSYWLMEDTKWQGEQIVIHPPVYPEKFKTTPGDGILLVTPDRAKGVELFLEIARRMPDRKFVIAKGRTSQTILNLPRNVSFINHLQDVRDVYSQTRLVLMPSREDMMDSIKHGRTKWVEGYGRVAMEAACSGIPTIGSRESRGLNECLGLGGMFAGQDDIEEWIALIEKLDNPEFYKEKSEYALKLVEMRHPDKYIDRLEDKLIDICSRAQE